MHETIAKNSKITYLALSNLLVCKKNTEIAQNIVTEY